MEKIRLENTQIPLHYQISDYILMMLQKGDIHPEDKLPPEEELKDIFGVSRSTIRRALEHLLNKGFLLRKQGKGTFWTETAYQIRQEKVSGINREIFDMNTQTSVRVLSKSVTRVNPEIHKFLQIDPETEIVIFKRMRYANGEPMSFSINYLPPKYGSHIDKSLLKEQTMLEALESTKKIELGTIEHEVEITRANQEISKYLKIPILDPVLTIKTSIFDTMNKPIEIVWTYFVENKYKFRVIFDR